MRFSLSYKDLRRSRRKECLLLPLLCHNSDPPSLLLLLSRKPLILLASSLALSGNQPRLSGDQADSTSMPSLLSNSSVCGLSHPQLVAFLFLFCLLAQPDLSSFSVSDPDSLAVFLSIAFYSSEGICISPVHVQHAVFHFTWSVKALLFLKSI